MIFSIITYLFYFHKPFKIVEIFRFSFSYIYLTPPISDNRDHHGGVLRLFHYPGLIN